ncbi:hypothetical protein CsSME_00004629 [Camellia sinensis var. sinensis]
MGRHSEKAGQPPFETDSIQASSLYPPLKIKTKTPSPETKLGSITRLRASSKISRTIPILTTIASSKNIAPIISYSVQRPLVIQELLPGYDAKPIRAGSGRDRVKVLLATYTLKDEARRWCLLIRKSNENLTWALFNAIFSDKYFP